MKRGRRCRFPSGPGLPAALAMATMLAACSQSEEANLSGSSANPPAVIANSTVAGYGNFGVSQPGTDWGMSDPYHVLCTGGCRVQVGAP